MLVCDDSARSVACTETAIAHMIRHGARVLGRQRCGFRIPVP